MIEQYRDWYEQECDSNRKMLDMLASIPLDRRDDPRFAQAVTLVAHLAACRENWLDRMTTGGKNMVDWWPKDVRPEELCDRYNALEARWSDYLGGLSDQDLAQDFEFTTGDEARYRWNVDGQIKQLIGHAFYHRGQVALLVSQLGGQSVDTDYLYWAMPRSPRHGRID
jgi:uncharacterized damage-inducible protein DinB